MWWRARYVAWREERRGVAVWGKIVWRAGKGGEVVVLGEEVVMCLVKG